MNITQENVGELQAELKVTLSPEDYKSNVNQNLKQQARKANIPGFRPGKVPVSVVRRMVGMSVVLEEVNKLVSQAVSDYLEEQALNILGDPLPKNKISEDYFDVKCEKELEFEFEMGLAPEVELNLELDELPPQYDIEVDDAYLQKEIDNLRDRHGTTSTPEEVGEKDVIYGRLNILDEEGNPTEQAEDKMVVINPARIKDESVMQPFLGKGVESTTGIDIFSLADTVEEISGILFMEPEDIEALRGKQLGLTLKRITRVELAEMGPEFFNKALGKEDAEEEEKIETEEAFRAELREAIAKEVKETPTHYYRRELRDKLLEAHPIALPDEFLKKWLKATNEKMSDEQVEEQYEGFAENTRWSLIVEKIVEQQPDLKVEREELNDSMLDAVRRSIPDLSEAQAGQYLEYAYQNEEMVNMHFNRLQEDKLFGYLESSMEPKTESITATEFFEMLEKKNAENA